MLSQPISPISAHEDGTSEAISLVGGKAPWLPAVASTLLPDYLSPKYANGFSIFIRQFSSFIREMYLGFHFGQLITGL